MHNYGYDSEGRIKTVDTTAATYIYGPGGERVRKEVGSDATDYVIFNGQTIAEHAPNGDWSDYVYAGSKRIVRADDHEDFIRSTGNCTSCGSQWADFSLGTAGYSYVIQSGDKIFFRQWQANGGRGGLLITAGSASSASLNDQDGIPLNADTYSNTWHFRRADLSSLAGNALSSISMRAEGPSGSGWEVDFREIVLVSTDGTVKPIYTRQPSVSVTTTSSSGMSSLSAQVIHWGSPSPEGAPLYYHGDHLGSARLLSGYSGYPISSSIFLPYGEEFNPQVTIHHYKFTGKERDGESGLDNFGARYFSSQYGRFMIPDWAPVPTPIPYADISSPQSLNLYAYVRNNPLSYRDIDGHRQECDRDTYSTGPNGELVVHGGECHEVADPQEASQQSAADPVWSKARGAMSQTQGSQTACTVARIASTTKGVLNLGVGAGKTGLAALSGASTPATGPLGGIGAAYLVIGAAGNISAGSIQLIGAITGNVNGTGQAATAATTATSVLGLGALLATGGNLQTASNWANIESLGTAGLNGGMTGHLIDQAATFAQKLFLSAELGQNAADAVGLNTGGTCH